MTARASAKPESIAIKAIVVLDAPYAKVCIDSEMDVLDHALMRSRQLAALLVAMQPEAGPDSLLWLAQQIADEVLGTVANIAGVKP